MYTYSFNTVMMAVITSNLLIITIAICFRSKKILLSVGYKLLAVFLILTLIRFALPFEFGRAKNIYLPEFLSIYIAYFRQELFKIYGLGISLWSMFEVIWAGGIIFQTVRYLRKLYEYEYFVLCWGEDVTDEEPYRSCLAKVCSNRKNTFRILKFPEMPSPCLYGIRKPRILISADTKMTDKDLYYILCHEVSHHYHHDLVIKRIISILCILYWWNPICYIFQKQVDTLLEMRIDDSLVQNDPKVAQEYLSTLVYILESMEKKSQAPNSFIVSLSQKNSTSLTQRFNMVCYKKPHVNILMCVVLSAIIIAMCLGSYLVTFENVYFIESEEAENTTRLVDSLHAVIKDDGTYDIYYGDFFIENVETLENHDSNIPIYNQE